MVEEAVNSVLPENESPPTKLIGPQGSDTFFDKGQHDQHKKDAIVALLLANDRPIQKSSKCKLTQRPIDLGFNNEALPFNFSLDDKRQWDMLVNDSSFSSVFGDLSKSMILSLELLFHQNPMPSENRHTKPPQEGVGNLSYCQDLWTK